MKFLISIIRIFRYPDHLNPDSARIIEVLLHSKFSYFERTRESIFFGGCNLATLTQPVNYTERLYLALTYISYTSRCVTSTYFIQGPGYIIHRPHGQALVTQILAHARSTG